MNRSLPAGLVVRKPNLLLVLAKGAKRFADICFSIVEHALEFPMNAMLAMKQYQRVGVQAQVTEASPHRLIQMLMQGGLDRIYQAKGAIEFGRIAEKGELIGKSIAIIGGLREALDHEVGGELSANLDRLYGYMIRRLTDANRNNDADALAEVAGLLQEVKIGWDGIAQYG